MGGRGSYSYGSGATDTKGGKKLIISGGGSGAQPMPNENGSNDLQNKYGLIGFQKIYGGDELMARGIPLPMARRDYHATQFWFERVNE